MGQLFNSSFMESKMKAIDYLNTPVGWLEINASNTSVTAIRFVEQKKSVNNNAISDSCKTQLEEYFFSDRKIFDLPLEPQGTDFQRSIWQQLSKIPYGVSASYRDIAIAVNNPKAVRAVGAANGRNPISIVVPCHRVIGSNGSLTGYAGGLERKQWLLKHEGLLNEPSTRPLDF